MQYRHFDGYQQVRQRILVAPLADLLETLDTLYGRDHLDDATNIDEVRAEALRQVERDWRREPEWGSV